MSSLIAAQLSLRFAFGTTSYSLDSPARVRYPNCTEAESQCGSMQEPRPLEIDVDVPLVVDFDGTLSLSDTVFESFTQILFRHPSAALAALAALRHGRAALKRFIAGQASLDYSLIPQRSDLIALLQREKARGRPIHLVTAADQSVADDFAALFPLFDSAQGSDGRINLKGRRKLEHLRARFAGGFIYAGDAGADVAIFRAARGAVLCDVSKRTAAAVSQAGTPVLAELRRPPRDWRIWVRLLRVHQWSKNVLLFVPLFVGHAFGEPKKVLAAAIAFLLLCLLASASYMVNDLADLDADRQHRTKRYRPFASGALPLVFGLVAAPFMIAAALVGGLALSPSFAGAMLVYLALTTTYSFGLKRVPLLDVFVIGVLFTLRIVMGTEAIGLGHSPWLLSFSLAFFLSLALAKRHGEIVRAAHANAGEISGRGYTGDDWPLTLTFGVGVGLTSIVIMLLYLTNDAAPSGFYGRPALLFVVPAVVTLWLMRIWLLSNRMQLHDDPVVFAVRDRTSLVLGVAVAVSFFLSL
jgi:4-hydroxybenzoate polyprenyltransferase